MSIIDLAGKGIRHYKSLKYILLKYMGFISICFFLINFKNEVPKCLKYDKHWRNRYF